MCSSFNLHSLLLFSDGSGKVNEEREQTLNQLLTEMDGFTPDTGVVFIGATNRADLLDPALMRPGRFDRKIRMPKPDTEGRYEILKLHLKAKKVRGRGGSYAPTRGPSHRAWSWA